MLSFLAFALVSSLTPGPNNSMLMASGLRFGIKRTLPHLLGINIGFGLMFLTVGSLLPLVPKDVFAVLEWVSIALLLYIAYKIAMAPTDFSPCGEEGKPWGFFKAVAFQWVNPKALMMAFAGATAFGLDSVTGALIFTVANMVCGIWIFAGVWLKKILIGKPVRTRFVYVTLSGIMVLSILG